MFEFIRRHQRLMLLVLLVLILPSFVLIGVSGYSNFVSGDRELVKIGDSAITAPEFDRALRMQLDEAQRSNPADFDIALYNTPEARRRLLETLVDQRVVMNVATEGRFSVSDSALRESIATIPQFQDGGSFSPSLYNQVLMASGLSVREFEQSQRGQLALSRVLAPVAETAQALPSVLEHLERALTEARAIRVKQFSAADYASQVSLSEEDLKQWYEANKESLRLPEQVVVEYVLLDEAAATASVGTPEEEQLKQYYEQNKNRYVQPARAHLSHILVNLAPTMSESQREQAHSKAKRVAGLAQADKDNFAALAKQESEDAGSAQEGGDLGWITSGSWPDALQKAVFSLKKGDVSDVIEGPSGFHIFKIVDMQPEQGETFEQARSKVVEEVRRQLASERFADMASELTKLVYDNESSLEPAADSLGLTLKKASGVTRQGLLPAQQLARDDAASASAHQAILDDNRVRRALFTADSLKGGKNAGVIEIAPDTIVAVRVAEVVPAHIPDFAEVEQNARQQLSAERALALASQAGEAELAQLQKQAAEPQDFAPEEQVSRADFGVFDESSLNKIMALDTETLPAYLGLKQGNSYRIVQVNKHIPGTTDQAAAQYLSAQIRALQGESESMAVLAALRVEQQVKELPAAEQELHAELNQD